MNGLKLSQKLKMTEPFIQELAKMIVEMHDATYQGNLNDDLAFLEYLQNNDYHHIRRLPDGTWIGLVDLMFTTALCVGLDRSGYARRYCYDDKPLAIAETKRLMTVNDEPEGWIAKRPQDGRK